MITGTKQAVDRNREAVETWVSFYNSPEAHTLDEDDFGSLCLGMLLGKGVPLEDAKWIRIVWDELGRYL